MLEDGHSFFTAKRGLLDQRVTIQVAKLPSGNFSMFSVSEWQQDQSYNCTGHVWVHPIVMWKPYTSG